MILHEIYDVYENKGIFFRNIGKSLKTRGINLLKKIPMVYLCLSWGCCFLVVVDVLMEIRIYILQLLVIKYRMNLSLWCAIDSDRCCFEIRRYD